jgi:hypothetical protein
MGEGYSLTIDPSKTCTVYLRIMAGPRGQRREPPLHPVDPYVDHDRARLGHDPGDKPGMTRGGHEDVGPSRLGRRAVTGKIIGITPDPAQRFWDKLISIAAALGKRFTWKRTPAGHDHIQLVKVGPQI